MPVGKKAVVLQHNAAAFQEVELRKPVVLLPHSFGRLPERTKLVYLHAVLNTSAFVASSISVINFRLIYSISIVEEKTSAKNDLVLVHLSCDSRMHCLVAFLVVMSGVSRLRLWISLMVSTGFH